MKKLTSIFTLLCCLSFTGVANATLIGDSVEGVMQSTLSIDTQLTSPQVVGAGPEFAGIINGPFGQIWDIVVDIAASSFTIGFNERNSAAGNVGNNPNLFAITLSDLNWVGVSGEIIDVVLSDYSCGGLGCGAFGSGPRISSINWGPDSIYVSNNVIRNGEVYTFDITAIHAVPAPTTTALLAVSLLGAGYARRSRGH